MSEVDDQLYHDPDLVAFYDIENDGREDFEFCMGMASNARSVLDLGCGTGQFAAAVAAGKRVVGADPAAAMLDIARHRQGGDRVRWVESTAQALRLDETFDLIVLTGHAFQVFLDDDAVLAVLKTIALHLAPDGRFIFDSRNPERQEWRNWVPETSERIVTHPTYGTVRAWNDVLYDDKTAIAAYTTFYDITAAARTLSAHSEIRFIARDRLAELIEASGLRVERWLGDWHGNGFDRDSKEIIPVGTLAV